MEIDISNVAAKYKASLRRADTVNPDDANAYNGKIDTREEILAAAALICPARPAAGNLTAAEACLRKELGLEEAPAAPAAAAITEPTRGIKIQEVSPLWGKGDSLKAKIVSGVLTISGTLEDSELYSVQISPTEIKSGQRLVFDVEVKKGKFTWGGKVFAVLGEMPDPEVIGGRLERSDSPWVVIAPSLKATVKIPIKGPAVVTVLEIKTGGMSNGEIRIGNIRVE